MTPDQLLFLLERQDQMLKTLASIHDTLVIGVFLALFGLLIMFGLAIWSVSRVNKRQKDLEGKFTLLIDVLLRQAERENMARAAAEAATIQIVEASHGN